MGKTTEPTADVAALRAAIRAAELVALEGLTTSGLDAVHQVCRRILLELKQPDELEQLRGE